MQHEFGIGAHEALNVRPAWEIDNLLGEYVAAQRRQEEGE